MTEPSNTTPAGRPGLDMRPAGMIAGAAPQPAATMLPISWSGSPWSLTGLSFLNFALTIVTLGIYGFWGRTEVRKRIWSSVRLLDEPLAYTGTGKELFLGFLIVFGIVLVPTLVITFGALLTFGSKGTAQFVTQMVIAIAFTYLGGVAIYRARRYRMSRTHWRGIRGSLEGSSWAFGWTNFWTLMIVPVLFVALGAALYFAIGKPDLSNPQASEAFARSYGVVFGIAYFVGILAWLLLVPWRTTKLQRHITNDMAFGSRPFAFEGSSRPLYLRFIARWVGVLILAIATPLAIYWRIGPKLLKMPMQQGVPNPPEAELTGGEVAFVVAVLLAAFVLYSVLTAWYKAAEANYFASVTRYEGQPFKLSITALGLIGLVVSNILITLVSLGILRPVAMARTAKYFVDNLSLDGPIDVAGISQSTAARSRTGEGLAQAFDIDAF